MQEDTRSSRFLHPHKHKRSRSYAPSLFDPVSAAQPFLGERHSSIEREIEEMRGKLEPGDVLKLYEVAYLVEGPILEIGRLAGKSTVVLASAVREAGCEGPIYSLELDDGLVTAADESLARRGLRALVHFIQGDSAEMIATIPGDFVAVFVDGGHSYRAVSRDILALRGRVREGGVVMFHDYFHKGNEDPDNLDYGVTRAVDDLAAGSGLEYRGRFGGIALFEQC